MSRESVPLAATNRPTFFMPTQGVHIPKMETSSYSAPMKKTLKGEEENNGIFDRMMKTFLGCFVGGR
jgi:hypothetical protein